MPVATLEREKSWITLFAHLQFDIMLYATIHTFVLTPHPSLLLGFVIAYSSYYYLGACYQRTDFDGHTWIGLFRSLSYSLVSCMESTAHIHATCYI
ncbi:hypothetical protein GGR51DRAFT_537494, partial [Nemania sp. FL0031]